MQRLISALSLTLMLSGWSVMAQVPTSSPLTGSTDLRLLEEVEDLGAFLLKSVPFKRVV